MISWKKYNALNQEQRQEWDFKFKDKLYLPFNSGLIYLVILTIAFSYILALFVTIENVPELQKYEEQVTQMLIQLGKITQLVLKVYIGEIVVAVMYNGWKIYSEWQWYKKQVLR